MNLVCAHCGLVYPLQNGLSLCPRCSKTDTESLPAPKTGEIDQSHSFGLRRWLGLTALSIGGVFCAYFVYIFIFILGAASWAK